MSKAPGARMMTDAELFELAVRVGVEPDEMTVDRDHGLLVSASAARKIAAAYSDKSGATALADAVAAADRGWRP